LPIAYFLGKNDHLMVRNKSLSKYEQLLNEQKKLQELVPALKQVDDAQIALDKSMAVLKAIEDKYSGKRKIRATDGEKSPRKKRQNRVKLTNAELAEKVNGLTISFPASAVAICKELNLAYPKFKEFEKSPEYNLVHNGLQKGASKYNKR
tara:strand:+ start:317 stop:766 length:450 start_codon:yes stop_codon:yes gene_type:complete